MYVEQGRFRRDNAAGMQEVYWMLWHLFTIKKVWGSLWRLPLMCQQVPVLGHTGHRMTRNIRVERAEDRLSEICILFELWLCLLSFIQRLFTFALKKKSSRLKVSFIIFVVFKEV